MFRLQKRCSRQQKVFLVAVLGFRKYKLELNIFFFKTKLKSLKDIHPNCYFIQTRRK